MELLGLGIKISGLLLSPVVLITTIALTLVLMSGIAANVLLYVEDMGQRWEPRSFVRRPRVPTTVPM